jgi:hypothetical protein
VTAADGATSRLRGFVWYGLGAAVVAAGLAVVVAWGTGVAGPVWAMAGLAYGAQLVAYLVLALVYGRARSFVLGWVSGIAIRFGAFLGVAVWVVLERPAHYAVRLLTFVGVLFVLALLEPLFLRQRRERR